MFVGKSLFGLYLVKQLLEHRYPPGQAHHVVWQVGRTNKVWLFKVISPHDSKQSNYVDCWDISYGIWDYSEVIIDNKYTVCVFDAPKPLVDGTAGKALLLTSPKDKEHAKEFKKGAEKLWMPVWSSEEMQLARENIYIDPAAQQRYTALYKFYGNNPRHVFGEHTSSQSTAADEARVAVAEQVEAMHSPNQLMALTRALAAGVIRNDQSHLLLHMHSTHPYRVAHPEWPSAYVRDQVMSHLTLLYRTKLQLFLAATRGIGEYGSLRGLMFEWFAHKRLAAGGSFAIELLSATTEHFKRQLITLPQPSDVVYWTQLEQLQQLSANEYGIPISRSQGAFDAVQKPNRLFQMTVSSSHTVSTYHTVACAHHLCPGVSPQFIFVIPTDVYAHFNGPQTLINKSRAEKEAAAQQLGQQPDLSDDETKKPPQLVRDMEQWKLELPCDLVFDHADGSVTVKPVADEMDRMAALVAAAEQPDVKMD